MPSRPRPSWNSSRAVPACTSPSVYYYEYIVIFKMGGVMNRKAVMMVLARVYFWGRQRRRLAQTASRLRTSTKMVTSKVTTSQEDNTVVA